MDPVRPGYDGRVPAASRRRALSPAGRIRKKPGNYQRKLLGIG
jgi:hypothetical protein